MKTTAQISEIDYINEVFPICNNEEHMPVHLYIEQLKESIVQLSELMLELDKEDRVKISDIMVKVSSAHKLLADMQTEVLLYGASLK